MADMSEMFKMISDKLNSDPDSISSILSAFQNMKKEPSEENPNQNTSSNQKETSSFEMPDIETLMKMKKIMESMNSPQNDARSNLLLSLKPYLRDNKKEKVDQYVKLLNISKVISIFNTTEDKNKSEDKGGNS